ncbi:hypothetical protein [Sorangium sp. So ce1335]|uniref:hypothetical protein n=1 Tax=Sorangium sp. So ce1335 TaxID=3133335 RepID=UPI003F60082C
MKPLSRDARRIMDAARAAEEPSRADHARIREKLLRRAGALAAAQAAASATTSTASATLPAAPPATAGTGGAVATGAGGAVATGAGGAVATGAGAAATGAGAAATGAGAAATGAGAAATGAGAALPFAAGGLGGLLAKIGAAAALLGALGGGTAVALREPAAAPAARHAAVDVSRITGVGINAPPPALVPAAAPSSSAAAAPPALPRLPAAQLPAVALDLGAPPPLTPAPRRRPALPVGSDARAPSGGSASAPSGGSASAPSGGSASAPSGGSASAPAAGSTLPGELALLRGAQGALRAGDAGRALALLEEHAAEFREGALRDERRAARVFALCALGRIDASRAEAARFLRDAPRSPLAERVRAACSRAAAP